MCFAHVSFNFRGLWKLVNPQSCKHIYCMNDSFLESTKDYRAPLNRESINASCFFFTLNDGTPKKRNYIWQSPRLVTIINSRPKCPNHSNLLRILLFSPYGLEDKNLPGLCEDYPLPANIASLCSVLMPESFRLFWCFCLNTHNCLLIWSKLKIAQQAALAIRLPMLVRTPNPQSRVFSSIRRNEMSKWLTFKL